MFKGTFEPLLGTAVCFQQSDTTGSESSGHSADLKYVAKTDKRLLMKRVYLEPNTKTTPDTTDPTPIQTTAPSSA